LARDFSQSANPFGEVLSKSLADQLEDAIFVGSLKGKGQLYKIYEVVKADPAWFSL
jgi:hypothetical protein